MRTLLPFLWKITHIFFQKKIKIAKLFRILPGKIDES